MTDNTITSLVSKLIEHIEPPSLPDNESVPHSDDERGSEPTPTRQIISDVTLEDILTAARLAPSANNGQTWRFITIRDKNTKCALSQNLPHTIAQELCDSSVAIVLCGVPVLIKRIRREQPFVFIDIPIALTHILLRTAELQLHHCWTSSITQEAERSIQQLLQVPDNVRIVAVIGLG